ncbi:hypothetical protein C8R44DRAFT_739419 [Mycena epipterygia]|nr:hypothetical protein C8R44DRAFT_739419 [Mycena epipterygia]
MASNLPSLDGTLGDLEIGLVLATFLYGIQTLQTFNYYRQYPEDGVRLKILVAVVWFLELGHTICGCHAVYLLTITFYGQPQHIMIDPPLSLLFMLLFHAGITFAVQTFFAFRVAMLSRRWFTTIVCCVLNLLRLACFLVTFAKLYKRPNLSLLVTEFRWMVIAVLSISPIVDVSIATALVYYLWRARDSHYKQTTRMVDTIIVWTVGERMVTLLSVFIKHRRPNPLSILGISYFNAVIVRAVSWAIFYLIQAKLFSNSMLASLNGRRRLRPFDPTHQNSGSHSLVFNSVAAATNPVLPRCGLSRQLQNSVVQTRRRGETVNDNISSMSFPSKQVVEGPHDFVYPSNKA